MSTFVPASRVSRIKVSPSTAAAARARELKAAGRDIVDMTVGEPDFDTPDNVKAAAHAAIDRGETKYTPVNGTLALRNAIIGDFGRRLGLSYADNEICVGGGAKQILFLALMASVENDAEVVIPAPYWVSYPDMVLANEGKPVIVQCPQEQGFKLTPEALEAAITPKTLWLILNAPSNPTGAA
jgi:aspartate aminotransferase